MERFFRFSLPRNSSRVVRRGVEKALSYSHPGTRMGIQIPGKGQRTLASLPAEELF